MSESTYEFSPDYIARSIRDDCLRALERVANCNDDTYTQLFAIVTRVGTFYYSQFQATQSWSLEQGVFEGGSTFDHNCSYRIVGVKKDGSKAIKDVPTLNRKLEIFLRELTPPSCIRSAKSALETTRN